jgi:hypothetical protein
MDRNFRGVADLSLFEPLGRCRRGRFLRKILGVKLMDLAYVQRNANMNSYSFAPMSAIRSATVLGILD